MCHDLNMVRAAVAKTRLPWKTVRELYSRWALAKETVRREDLERAARERAAAEYALATKAREKARESYERGKRALEQHHKDLYARLSQSKEVR